MGIRYFSFYSSYLRKEMRTSVYIPQNANVKELPVLYFLHGQTGDERLLEQLGVEHTMERLQGEQKVKPMIIVCPNLNNSRGIDSCKTYQRIQGKHGMIYKGLYEKYLILELIPYVEKWVGTRTNREHRFIGGISAGGYAALHNGFRHPELFSKIGGHMPAVDLSYEQEDEEYFKDLAMWEKYDPILLAEKNDLTGCKVYLDDGKEDEGKFYVACKKLYEILKKKHVQVENHLFQGCHNGEYVVANMERYLEFYSK